MMNALLALDEMQASNNINMNLAAATPALMMLYSVKRVFQFVFYATFKLGKSREETYAMFRHILTEVERLLVMRDNPPTPPVLSGEESAFHLRRHTQDASRQSLVTPHDSVLNTDDLGMLMLHIHELRTILWRDRRRFSWSTIRSVAEDLAELAGERGKFQMTWNVYNK
jgi:ATP synthase regulation protein NCA2